MKLRAIFLLLTLSFATSCKYFEVDKKTQQQEIDMLVDFSVVDVSPIFQSCKDFLEKQEQTKCFRTSLHKHISESLAKHSLIVKKPLNEIVQIDLLIDKQGVVSVKEITSSEAIKLAIPNLDSIIALSLKNLPKLFPASKRGIPVTTQYQIPIKINVE